MNNVGPQDFVMLGTTSATGAITGVTTGSSQMYRRPGYGILTVIGESVGTTSGGTILIEEARLNAQGVYEGTWSTVQSMTANDFTGGAQKAYHLPNAAYGALRARISSDITGGGKVIVYLLSQAAG